MRQRSCSGCGLPVEGRHCPRCKPKDTGSRGGSTRAWRTKRARVLKRDRYLCQLRLPGCTVTATHVDHLKPRSQGGTDHESNLVAACAYCNLSKGARPVDDRRPLNG